jgi:hypothetical protein
MPVSFQVLGAETLAAGLKKAAERTLPTETRSAMEHALLLVESDARRGVKRDTGRLQNSITHRIDGSGGGNLRGEVGPSVRYGLYVERGRRPGRPPPVSALTAWARRHGVSPYVVARAIGRRGVRPAPFLIPAYERNRARIITLFEKIGLKVVETARG